MRAHGNRDWGTAIDQLNEVARVLVYRAIELSGPESGAGSKMVEAIRLNAQDYGAVVKTQSIIQKWSWMAHLASLYEMRTEHLTPRGSMEPHEPQDDEAWLMASRLFRVGGERCLRVIETRIKAGQAGP